ncbi:MAG: hypothetical protein ACTSO4_14455 [Promethearchaeota archaeon]
MLDQINNKISKRWTIIFEDFSISSLDKQKLKNYMERDNPNDKINFIIAGLEDKLEDLHTPTAIDRKNERIIFYKTSKTGENIVLFLNEDNCVEFIKPYINYFKVKEKISTFVNNGGDINKLNKMNIDFNKNAVCNKCNKCNPELRELFPFNESFLRKIFEGLKIKGEQKPRKYVEIIGLILRDYLEHKIPPSSAICLSELANKFIIPKFISNLNNEDLNNFLRWYGEENENYIKFPKIFANLFGIKYSGINGHVEKEEFIIIPKSSNNPIEIKSYKKKKEEKFSEWERKYDELRGYIVNWRKDPYNSIWNEFHLYILDAISDIFKYFTNGYFINTNSPFSIKIGKNERIFTFNNQGFSNKDNLHPFQITIYSEDLTESEIDELLRYGIHKAFKTGEYPLNKLLKKTPYILIEGLNKWQEICQDYIYNFPYFKGKNGKELSLVDIAFAYCVISFVILYPWKIFSYENFKVFLLEEKVDYKIPKYLMNKLQNQKDLKKVFSEFLKHLHFAKILLLDFLKISNSNVLDYILFKNNFLNKEMCIFKILKAIKKSSMDNYCKNRILINFKDKKIGFENFFEKISTLNSFLTTKFKNSFEIDLDLIEKEKTFIWNNTIMINFKNMKKIYNQLKTFDKVDRNLLANIKELLEKKQYIKVEKDDPDSCKFIQGIMYLNSGFPTINNDIPHDIKAYFKFRIFLIYHWVHDFENILNLIQKINDSLIDISYQNIRNLNNILILRDYLD